ncbi:MAG: hypothetical protein RIR00_1937 [Pseudomonadota bacterium]
MRVGFIGLGVMGRPMAGHLHAAGHALAVWSRRPETAAPLLAAGASLQATPRELAAACDVVFTMVTAGDDVENLVAGPDGLAAGFAPGGVLIDCSTIAPDAARRVGARLAEVGAHFLDAPVSGGAQGAIDAKLAIMVGGEAAVLAQVRPLLACLGPRIVHVGPQGAGQVAKACNQMIMVAAIEAAAEAMHFAATHGVDCGPVHQALCGGSAGSRVLDIMGARMVERNFAAGIEARLHHKDYGIIEQAAKTQGTPLLLTAQVSQQLNALMQHGWGKDDTSSLLRVLEAKK